MLIFVIVVIVFIIVVIVIVASVLNRGTELIVNGLN